MHSQQPTHRAHDAASFDILRSPPYPTSSFPDVLGDSKATHPPHPSPQYIHQQYAPDSDPPLEAQRRSPPRQYCLQEQQLQQGHSRIGHPSPPPALQQPQPRQAAAYPLFPPDHEGQNPTHQDLYPQIPHGSQHPSHIPMDPWVFDTFNNNTGAQPTTIRGAIPRLYDFTYSLHSQPRYPLLPAHPSATTHAPPPEHSPTTTVSGLPTFHEQPNESAAVADTGQRSRSWGAGSLDPTTGVFSRATDHPRIRTAQACEKCRLRKAKCSGDHPTCQRCQARGLVCAYAAERRMRGPNKPKPPPPPLQDCSHPATAAAAAEGQKSRRRASTLPSAPRRGLQIWGQESKQQKHRQSLQHEGFPAAASPASPASSVGSGSFGYPPLSESEASPMTTHSSLDSRHPSDMGFPASPRVFVQDFSATARSGMLGHVNGGNGYEEDGAVSTEGVVVGGYGQDVFPDARMPSAKALF